MSELINIHDTALKLHIAEITLRRLIKSRKIPFHRIGRKYFFTDENIKQYLESVSYPIIKEEK
jgi:excisionase family DNA binding protein